jgi:pimeloyl-ACP methyl ester carboxylesterase
MDHSWERSRRAGRVLFEITALTGLAAAAAALWAAARARPDGRGAPPPQPPAGLPPGRLVAVPGHGELFIREAPGPERSPDGRQPPTFLLLHGWMFPSDLNWFTLYGPLSEVGRVIAVDHRGHGRGTRPSTPFRLVDVADDAAALVRHLDAGPVIAIGFSLGGPVTQLLWRRHPELVRGLVLCATAASFSDSVRNKLVWRGMGLLQILLRLLPRHWWEDIVHRQARGELPIRVSRMITADTPPEVVELLPWIIGELDRGSAEDIAEAGRELGRYDGRGWLGNVDVPTGVVITTRDQLVPADDQRALAACIPRARSYEIPLDHDAPVSRPDVFAPALLQAIEDVLADAGKPDDAERLAVAGD